MARKITQEDFVRRAREVHGNKYDYSKAVYTRTHDHVTIICPIHGEFRQSPANHIRIKNTRGCPTCGGSKPLTTEIFKVEANAQHLSKYNYDKVDYKNHKTKVIITCPIHGDFKQIAGQHLKGHGCPKCGGCGRYTTESFIEEAREVHGDKYNYSEAEYITAHKHLIIICPKHGEFKMSPTAHLTGSGCKLCGYESASEKQTSNTEEFIAKAKAIHGDKFDYSLVDYKRNSMKVKIICPTHGIFEQTVSDHLSGYGCNQCGIEATADARRKTTEQFIEEAKAIHGDTYDYSLVDYVTAKDKVTIICKKHGEFTQNPHHHVKRGHGCIQCAESGFDPTKPAILYYLKVLDGRAYKIGITNRTVEQRFKKDMEYIKILKEWQYDLGEDAYIEEQRILKEYKDAKYHGISILNDGNSELFSYDILGFDK